MRVAITRHALYLWLHFLSIGVSLVRMNDGYEFIIGTGGDFIRLLLDINHGDGLINSEIK